MHKIRIRAKAGQGFREVEVNGGHIGRALAGQRLGQNTAGQI
jgi:hypothetical protein